MIESTTRAEHYNTVRLNSAIGYLTPAHRLAGRRPVLWATRGARLASAGRFNELAAAVTAHERNKMSKLDGKVAVVTGASKGIGAVEAITGVLARELGPRKIRVNSINPGMVDTEGTRSAGFIGSDFEKALIAQTPLGRIAQPDEIADIAVFLASRDARWLTGEILIAAGGLR